MKISRILSTAGSIAAVVVGVGASAADGLCDQCVLGPITLSVTPGKTKPFRDHFVADPAIAYMLVLEQAGASAASARIELNGEMKLDFGDPIGAQAPKDIEVTLKRHNRISIALHGGNDAALRVKLLPTSALPLSRQPCGSRRDFFTAYPFRIIDRVIGIFPLGNLSGTAPGHILPSDHIYVHIVPDQVEPEPVASLSDFYSPGELELVAVSYLPLKNNYELILQPCREVRVFHAHVHEFDPAVAPAVNPSAFICPAELGGTFCAQRTSLAVSPGQRLGSVVNSQLDWGVTDVRRPPLPFANPVRYDLSAFPVPPSLAEVAPYIAADSVHRYCPIDYLSPQLQTADLLAKFGSWDGTQQRTVPPICGEHAQDILGTAQGNWFGSAADSQFTENEGALALVHDNVDPTLPVFSVSLVFCQTSGQCVWDTGLRHFSPAAAGQVNRDFADVTPGAVYCYESLKFMPQIPDPQIGVVLLEVFSSVAGGPVDRMRIEPIPVTQAQSCGPGPWSFSAAVREFQR
jgi:hypothetical protein